MAGGLMAASAILGGIGGALEGAVKHQKTDGTVPQAANNSVDYSTAGEKIGGKLKEQPEQPKAENNKVEVAKTNDEEDKKKDSGIGLDTVMKAVKGSGGNTDSVNDGIIKPKKKCCGVSDEDLKNVYGDIDDKIIENFAKISAIDFTYKPEAQEKYNGELGVDNKEHVGVIAQELQSNEATKGTVVENENGDLQVDTRHLAFADTAAIAELSRRVLALEEVVKELQNNRGE